jgi:hypothetical protein
LKLLLTMTVKPLTCKNQQDPDADKKHWSSAVLRQLLFDHHTSRRRFSGSD